MTGLGLAVFAWHVVVASKIDRYAANATAVVEMYVVSYCSIIANFDSNYGSRVIANRY